MAGPGLHPSLPKSLRVPVLCVQSRAGRHQGITHQSSRPRETLGYQLLLRHLKRRVRLCLLLWPRVLPSTQTRLSHKQVCLLLLLWPTGLHPTWAPMNRNRVQLLFASNRHGQDTLRNVTATMCDNSINIFSSPIADVVLNMLYK
ncbi:hypothetical protein HPB49_019048 [Dermacentor silvarum]|uniref:Uncharacterized protein n=1 Tax=Dermacentor silvarum TaxID=543639 RepID=A0ACB8DKM5_DERSI|nr:hypothetical protein HPB49_019048 [Dermacentor silvarum]